ncbi:hypothetical protein [Catenuloplanes japonicus]|uniref:hypothetical protein n=1 Tax=Catenuloplanes japonicus TaxID=33876 RepID=UPI0005279B98|nr:hypothetical protein [Catenuloplanes japonicus]
MIVLGAALAAGGLLLTVRPSAAMSLARAVCRVPTARDADAAGYRASGAAIAVIGFVLMGAAMFA